MIPDPDFCKSTSEGHLISSLNLAASTKSSSEAAFSIFFLDFSIAFSRASLFIYFTTGSAATSGLSGSIYAFDGYLFCSIRLELILFFLLSEPV